MKYCINTIDKIMEIFLISDSIIVICFLNFSNFDPDRDPHLDKILISHPSLINLMEIATPTKPRPPVIAAIGILFSKIHTHNKKYAYSHNHDQLVFRENIVILPFLTLAKNRISVV